MQVRATEQCRENCYGGEAQSVGLDLPLKSTTRHDVQFRRRENISSQHFLMSAYTPISIALERLRNAFVRTLRCRALVLVEASTKGRAGKGKGDRNHPRERDGPLSPFHQNIPNMLTERDRKLQAGTEL